MNQPVYWNDEVCRAPECGPRHIDTVERFIPYGYGDSAGQHTGTLAQKQLYVPKAGITLVQFAQEELAEYSDINSPEELNVQLEAQYTRGKNRIYDRDGDGVQDNIVYTSK